MEGVMVVDGLSRADKALIAGWRSLRGWGMIVSTPSCVVANWEDWYSICWLLPILSNAERSSYKLSCWTGVDGTSGVLPSVLMDGRDVGTAVGFLVGNRCWFCFRGERWGGGWTGGPYGGNFGVAPFLILYWWIFWRIWGGRKGNPCFQKESKRLPVCLHVLKYCLVSSEIVESMVSWWWDIVAQETTVELLGLMVF